MITNSACWACLTVVDHTIADVVLFLFFWGEGGDIMVLMFLPSVHIFQTVRAILSKLPYLTFL